MTTVSKFKSSASNDEQGVTSTFHAVCCSLMSVLISCCTRFAYDRHAPFCDPYKMRITSGREEEEDDEQHEDEEEEEEAEQ